MTDDELLALLQSKSPEEFTAEEIEALRSRLRESESLRKIAFETLQLETRLTTALGSFEINSDDLVKRVERNQRERSLVALWTIVAGIGLISLVVLGGVLLRAALAPGNNEEAIAQGAKTPVSSKQEAETAREQSEEKQKALPPGPSTTAGSPDASQANETPAVKGESSPPAKTAVAEPWAAELAKERDSLPKFAEVSLRDFAYQTYLPRAADLQRWFEPIGGAEFRLGEADVRGGKVGFFEGTARVRAPLPADGGLRLALKKDAKLRIYAYAGEHGIVFKHFSEPRETWTAYRVRRQGREVKPIEYDLCATDEERSRRTEAHEGGPIEVRYFGETKEIALLRGDIELLRAPLSAPPDDLVLYGRAIVEGIEIVRSTDAPPAKKTPEPTYRLIPAEAAWVEKLSPTTKLERQADGSLILSSNKNEEASFLAIPIPGFGPREITFEVENASPGFAVFLGRGEKGEYVGENLKFVRNKKSGRLCLQMQTDVSDTNEVEFETYPERLERAVAPNLSLKLLYGCGVLQWRWSVDGVNWAAGEAAGEWSTENVKTLGVMLGKNGSPSQAKLRNVAVREFPAFAKLAPRELVKQAPSLVKARTYDQWYARWSSLPISGNDRAAWRRACALRTLGDGAVAPVSVPILERLLEDSRTILAPLEELELLREAMVMVIDLRSGQAMRKGIPERIYDWAYENAGATEFDAITLARRAAMEAPASTYHWFVLDDRTALERLLLRDLQVNDRAAVRRHVNDLRLFRLDREFTAIDWFEHQVRGGEEDRSSRSSSERRETWPALWTEELNKEAYNFTAELQSLLESGATKEAAAAAVSLDAAVLAGLTPAVGDSAWFYDLPIALRLAARKTPEFSAEMKRNAALAQLRVRNAAAAGDEEMLRLAAVQFAGTEAAAEAHRRLGDRSLQNGWFAAAEAEYRAAQFGASAEVAKELPARLRFAAAMQGREEGSPVTVPVDLGGMKLSAAEFESLVQEMKSRGGDAYGETSTEKNAVALPPIAALGPKKLARLDGRRGNNPLEEGMRGINEALVDWPARQLATRIEGDVLYVSNRFELAAYRLSDGARAWQTQPPSGEMRRAQDSSLIPMRPLVLGDRILVRTLYGKGTSLTAFSKSDGKTLWHKEGTESENWASDPIVVQGQTGAIRHVRGDRAGDRLVWTVLDPLTGDVLQSRTIAQVREVFRYRKTCEIAALPDGFLLSLEGLALRCNARGETLWARRFFSTPLDPLWRSVRQWYETPRILGDRAILMRPGGHSIDCVAIETGELLWSNETYEPRRIVAASPAIVVAETHAGFLGLNAQSGKVVWETNESEERLAGVIASETTLLYALRRVVKDQDRTSPVLVWRNLTTGQEEGRFALPEITPDEKDVRLGPFLTHGGRLFAFAGKESEPQRDFIQLEPQPSVRLQPYVSLNDHWLPALPQVVTEAVAERFAPWHLVSASFTKPTKEFGFRPEFHTEKDVVLVPAAVGHPVLLRYSGQLPETGRVDLTLRLCSAGNQKGVWQVVCGGQIVAEKSIDPAQDKEPWFDWSLPLEFGPDKLQGELHLLYRAVEGGEHAVALRRLRVSQLDSKP